MHRSLRSSLLVAMLVGTATGPAWAGFGLNAWLVDASRHRQLWTILYVMLGVLVLLVAWEAFFQLQRRRERLQVDLSHSSPPPLEGASGGASASGSPRQGGTTPPAASDEDPFKSLLRRSAAAAHAEADEEKARVAASAQSRATAPAARPSPPQEAAPAVSESPPAMTAFQPPPEDPSSLDAASGGRKMVRLSLGGDLGADEGPEPVVEPRRPASGASPPRIAITPAPDKPGAGKDAWSDLLKKAPSAPSAPAPSTDEGHTEAAGDPWKSLLKKTRDEGTPGSSSGAVRLGGAPSAAARNLPPRGGAEAGKRTSGPVPPPQAPSPQAPSATGVVSLPLGATRASWAQGVGRLQAALVGRCTVASKKLPALQASVESEGAPGGGAPSEPKRGRRMKLAGAADTAAADVGDVASASSQEAEPGSRRVPTGAPVVGTPLVSPVRRSGAEARGEGEPLRLAERPPAGQGLRIVRSTRESHGDAEKEIPGVLRNAEENYRPGEVPAGTDKSRAAQGDSTESL